MYVSQTELKSLNCYYWIQKLIYHLMIIMHKWTCTYIFHALKKKLKNTDICKYGYENF